MTETKQTGSLFDSREVWAAEPLVAVEALLKSPEYLQTGMPRAHPGPGPSDKASKVTQLSDDSVNVYRAMFGKYMTVLADMGCPSVVEVTEEQISQFFEGEAMAKAKKETVNRYRRLLERVYDFLVSRGYIETNPVNAWLANFREHHSNRKPEDGKDRSQPDVIDQGTVLRLREWLRDLGQRANSDGDWRTLRNVVAAMLSVGTGLRARELQLLKRSQLTIRRKAPAGEKIEIYIPMGATVRTGQMHRVMVDALAEDLVMAWHDLRFVSGVRPVPGAEAKVLPGDSLFIGIGREQGRNAAKHSNELSVTNFNRALKKFAGQAKEEGVIDEMQQWLLCRGAQGLRRAYALVEIQSEAKPTDLRIKMGLHLEASVKKYEHQLKAGVRTARAKV